MILFLKMKTDIETEGSELKKKKILDSQSVVGDVPSAYGMCLPMQTMEDVVDFARKLRHGKVFRRHLVSF
jgi:hypothetical protein